MIKMRLEYTSVLIICFSISQYGCCIILPLYMIIILNTKFVLIILHIKDLKNCSILSFHYETIHIKPI